MKENIKDSTNFITTDSKNAELEIRTQLFEGCNRIASLGGCSVSECLECHNSDYRIVMSGVVVKDFDSGLPRNIRGKDIERYVIEFFDDFKPGDDIVEYLNNPDSNYKITKESNRTVLRDANSNNSLGENVSSNLKTKSKTLIKELVNNFKRKCSFR